MESFWRAPARHRVIYRIRLRTPARLQRRRLGLLSRDYVEVVPTIAQVKELDCVGCSLCVEVCPYGAPSLVMKRGSMVSEINEALCKGCGLCVAGCRGKAITLRGFNDTQLLTQLETLLQFSMS